MFDKICTKMELSSYGGVKASDLLWRPHEARASSKDVFFSLELEFIFGF